MKRIMLITILIIFCLGTIVNAQCAWVLCYQKAYYKIENNNAIENKFWEIEAAFPKYEQCLGGKKVLFSNIKEYVKKSDPKVDSVPFELVIEHFTETSALHHSFLCLPDTIDPRK